jgi:hypothetical protein
MTRVLTLTCLLFFMGDGLCASRLSDRISDRIDDLVETLGDLVVINNSTDDESDDDLTRSMVFGGPIVMKHSVSYLHLDQWPDEDMAVFKLYESSLMTFFSLSVREKQYVADLADKKMLNELNTFCITSTADYELHRLHSLRMNSFLPCRDTFLLGHLRRPFSYFCPAIDFYQALAKVRLTNPVGAAFIDYLFTEKPEEAGKAEEADKIRIKSIVDDASRDCAGQMSRSDYLTLFAMQAFGFGGMLNLPLAKLEAGILKDKCGLDTPLLILRVKESHQRHLDEQERQTAADLYEYGVCAEELNFDVFSDLEADFSMTKPSEVEEVLW